MLALQVHSINREELKGIKLYWKNIRINTANVSPTTFPKGIYVANLIPNSLNGYEVQDGWRLLFDGRSSEGDEG